MIEYCGTEPHLYGYSVLQLIQTSDITAHFCDATGDAYIDIFSCKEYNPAAAGLFCQDYFKAENMIWSCSLRGKGKRL
jgi:S-adenosylmethionine/arginine decarboxylase-like enzyme